MSYILDALRRADAERERGEVPGLHAQQDPFEEAEAPAQRGRPVLLVVVGVLAAALLGMVGWTWWRSQAPAAVVAEQSPPAPGPAPLAPTSLPTTSPLPSPAPAAQTPSAPPEASDTQPAPPRAAPERSAAPTGRRAQPDEAAPAPAPAPAPVPRSQAAAEVPRSPERSAPPSAADNPAPPPVPTTRTSAPDAPRVYTLDSLPSHIRAEVPRLSIGGASYSDNPASRMLIVNGQVFREHDKLGPNHSLEEIGHKHAVLDYKGFRYRLTF